MLGNEKPNREPEQIGLDLRTDQQALDEARTKKLEDMDDREKRLIAVEHSREDSENKRGTIDGQRFH